MRSLIIGLGLWLCGASLIAGELRLVREKSDPYGCPRPAPGETNVPVTTSHFLKIGFLEEGPNDVIRLDSVRVRLGKRGKPSMEIVQLGPTFADGYTGRVVPSDRGKPTVLISIDGGPELEPSTA